MTMMIIIIIDNKSNRLII